MLFGGLYLVFIELMFAHAIYLRGVICGTLLAGLGAYLIWADFVAPRLGIKTWEDSQG
jgi:hypothetical protein